MNMTKLEIVTMGNVPNVKSMASILGCEISQLLKNILAFRWVLCLNQYLFWILY